MEGREKITRRRPRSDGAANRAKILEAAHAAFREEVSDISLEEIARRAGVGIGTLYRHFASRDVLAAAVYHQEVDDLVALAAQLESEGDAASALQRWLRAMVEFVATKKGMAAALARSARMPSELTNYSSDHLVGAVERLLLRITEGGRAAPPIAGQDVLLMLVALSYEFDGPGWEERVGRLFDIFVWGLTRTDGGDAMSALRAAATSCGRNALGLYRCETQGSALGAAAETRQERTLASLQKADLKCQAASVR